MVRNAEGAIYTRWGKASCPDGHGQVYTGYIAGTRGSSRYGSASLMCLTSEMRLDQYSLSDNTRLHVYRAEYVDPLQGSRSTSTDMAWMNGLHEMDALCSVCQTPGRSWSLTVAGSNECPVNFELDYGGYLMAEHERRYRQRGQYLCVDRAAEGVPGSAASTGSANLYPVETAGGLGSYIDLQEVTCAQCSSNGGPTYVRWGRSTCPEAASLVYVGLAAGPHRDGAAGGGYNLQCLIASPAYGEFSTGATTKLARLYRVQYETAGLGLWRLWHLQDMDMPCAVCQTTGSLSSYMQPGSSSCREGWSTEYTGTVLAAPYNRYRACLLYTSPSPRDS